jgi:hypothetical protein
MLRRDIAPLAADSVVPDLDDLTLRGVHDNMGTLHSAFEAEYARLKECWAQLLAERDQLDMLRARIQSVSVKENERLKLNVAGKRYEIRRTCVQKNTYFRSLLSGAFAPADDDGFFYIERDPTHVNSIMNVLRDGDTDLDRFTERELDKVRTDAEFFMVQELSSKVDRQRTTRRSGDGVVVCSVNRDASVVSHFNGVFFEVTVLRRDLRLHSIAFVAGETRKMVGEAFLKEGSIDSTALPRKIGDVEQAVEKGQLATINFASIPLTGSVYTIGVYSSSCPTAIAAVPTNAATRDFNHSGFVVGKTYHTTNPRGHWTKRAGDDEYDFVGEVSVSFS